MDPKRTITKLMYYATRVGWTPYKTAQIRWFVRRYNVDMTEAEEQDSTNFRHFNEFFTRSLRPGLRPMPSDTRTVASPVDGTISEFGAIEDGTLLQAKGRSFSLGQLVVDPLLCDRLNGGNFMTIYLSPRDYHRVHAPLAGALRQMTYVPGEFFSVNPKAVANVPDLFARNERVVFDFGGRSPYGLVMVGAMCVSSIETRWDGPLGGPRGTPTTIPVSPPRDLARGEQFAHFNMGSTVILLFPRNAMCWEALQPGDSVRLGQPLGQLTETR